jgi:hypothetical protein
MLIFMHRKWDGNPGRQALYEKVQKTGQRACEVVRYFESTK